MQCTEWKISVTFVSTTLQTQMHCNQPAASQDLLQPSPDFTLPNTAGPHCVGPADVDLCLTETKATVLSFSFLDVNTCRHVLSLFSTSSWLQAGHACTVFSQRRLETPPPVFWICIFTKRTCSYPPCCCIPFVHDSLMHSLPYRMPV